MDDEKYKNFLLGLGTLTTEYAKEAIADFLASKGSKDEQLKTGYMMGFHRFITLMQQQAEAFEIPLKELGIETITENDFLV